MSDNTNSSTYEYLNDKAHEKIKEILQKGDRVELIPTKDSVKIIHIKRNVVKL